MPSMRPSTCSGTPEIIRLRRRAEPLRPVLPHQVVIAADAAGGDDHRLRPQREVADHVARTAGAALDAAVGSSTAPLTPSTAPAVCVSASTRWRNRKLRRPPSSRLAGAAHERLDDAGAGAPGDVEARHRIAVAHRVVAAALGPADHRERCDAPSRAARRASRRRRSATIGLGPAPRPVIVVAVEAGRAEPVLQREIVAVADAEPALLRRVDEEQAAERPERLAAEILLAFLIEHDHALAGIGDLGGGDQPGEAAADHDHVRICRHARSSFPGTD